MRNSKAPESDGSKADDKASGAFAKAIKSKAKGKKSPAKSPKAARNKQAKGKKADAVTKTIKKTTPKGKVPNIKVKVNAALKNQSPAKTQKVVKVKTVTPKKATKEKAGKSDPKSPKSPKSTKKSPKATNGTGEKTPKGKKKSPAKSPAKKSAKATKKLPSPATSPMKLVIPLKTSPQKTKSPAKAKSTPKSVKTPPKSVKKPPKSVKTPAKSPKTPKSSKSSPVKSPKVTKTSPTTKSPKKSPSPPKLNPKSVAIKKKKKPALKNKIKIAGLIGKKVAKSKENGVEDVAPTTPAARVDLKKLKKLPRVLPSNASMSKKKKTGGRVIPNVPLRVKMMDKLQAARFRYLNEELYTQDSQGAVKLFEEDPDAFAAYHEGYRRQVKVWPMNPLTKIIATVKGMSEKFVVADFGCGDAELSKSVKQNVHSFDLVAANERVTACDMANVPLDKHSVDVAVFCLSLMGTNLQDFLLEANRVLKVGGMLLIAEVESRFDKVENFIAGLDRYGFANVHKDFEHNFFYIMHFRKERDIKNKKKLPTIGLLPCVYKRR